MYVSYIGSHPRFVAGVEREGSISYDYLYVFCTYVSDWEVEAAVVRAGDQQEVSGRRTTPTEGTVGATQERRG